MIFFTKTYLTIIELAYVCYPVLGTGIFAGICNNNNLINNTLITLPKLGWVVQGIVTCCSGCLFARATPGTSGDN